MQVPEGFRKVETTELEQSILVGCYALMSVGFLFSRAGQTQGPLGCLMGAGLQIASNEAAQNVILTLSGVTEERQQRQLGKALEPFKGSAYAGNPNDLQRDLHRIAEVVRTVNGKGAAQAAADRILHRFGGG